MPLGQMQPEHPGYIGPANAYDCQQCITAQARKKQFPSLGEENLTAWNLYLQIQGQQRVGGLGEPIALDVQAIEPMLRLSRVPLEDWPLTTEKLLIIDRAMQEDRDSRRRQEETARKNKSHQDAMRARGE